VDATQYYEQVLLLAQKMRPRIKKQQINQDILDNRITSVGLSKAAQAMQYPLKTSARGKCFYALEVTCARSAVMCEYHVDDDSGVL
jgi:hypothetical protein